MKKLHAMANSKKTDTETKFDEYLNSLGVELRPTYIGEAEKENWVHDKWSICATRRGGRAYFDFSTGTGHRGDINNHIMVVFPEAASVINSLLLDSEVNGNSFEEWCCEFGYNNDSISDKKLYDACLESDEKLSKIFSKVEIEKMRELLADY